MYAVDIVHVHDLTRCASHFLLLPCRSVLAMLPSCELLSRYRSEWWPGSYGLGSPPTVPWSGPSPSIPARLTGHPRPGERPVAWVGIPGGLSWDPAGLVVAPQRAVLYSTVQADHRDPPSSAVVVPVVRCGQPRVAEIPAGDGDRVNGPPVPAPLSNVSITPRTPPLPDCSQRPGAGPIVVNSLIARTSAATPRLPPWRPSRSSLELPATPRRGPSQQVSSFTPVPVGHRLSPGFSVQSFSVAWYSGRNGSWFVVPGHDRNNSNLNES